MQVGNIGAGDVIRQRLPRNVYSAVRTATSFYGALQAARYMMGKYAPSEKDLKFIYNYAKRSTMSRSGNKGPYKRPTLRRKKGLKNQVKELKRLAESDMGTHIDRVRETDRTLVASVNQKQFAQANLINCSKIETALSNLKYYDPTAPTTLVTASAASGSFQKEFLVETAHCKFHFRNNYQIPARVCVYICRPKSDTSIGPFSAFTSGLTDVGGPSATSPLVYPTDSEQFNDLWTSVKTKKVLLQPGSEFSMTHSAKSFQYDPSYFDSHNLEFIKKYGACAILISVEGVIGHDTTADEQGTLLAGIDWYTDCTYKIKYAAGADIKQVVVTNNSDSFTNGPVISNKPVSDNQNYSVA